MTSRSLPRTHRCCVRDTCTHWIVEKYVHTLTLHKDKGRITGRAIWNVLKTPCSIYKEIYQACEHLHCSPRLACINIVAYAHTNPHTVHRQVWASRNTSAHSYFWIITLKCRVLKKDDDSESEHSNTYKHAQTRPCTHALTHTHRRLCYLHFRHLADAFMQSDSVLTAE